MPLRQRRPSPIQVIPIQRRTLSEDRVARGDILDSPQKLPSIGGGFDSPDTPDGPFPLGLVLEAEEKEKEREKKEDDDKQPPRAGAAANENEEPPSPKDPDTPRISSGAPPAATSQGNNKLSAEPSAAASGQIPSSQSQALSAQRSSAPTVAASSQTPSLSTLTSGVPTVTAASSASLSQTQATPLITQSSSSTRIASITDAAQTLSATTSTRPGTSQNAAVQRPSSTSVSAASRQSEVAGGAGLGQDPLQKSNPHHDGRLMSPGAEAALITVSILGAVALIVGALLMFKKRRRMNQENAMRHAEDAFNPGNIGSLHNPETTHMSDTHTLGTQATGSTTANTLFAPKAYVRPETALTTSIGRSRIQPPEPTPNPFADPPLNKSYDLLRGRPRSTTLTDRGSWLKNPFKDPMSDRFDPFGDLEERARQERVRYVEDARKEKEYLDRGRARLGPDPARNGSGVTIEGLGVLDRSGQGRRR